MLISKNHLKILIRNIFEQVVGYSPPSRSSSSGNLMSYGDISSPVSKDIDPLEDPEDYEQLGSESQSLTKQRQKAVNQGDAIDANYDSRTLQKLKNKTG